MIFFRRSLSLRGTTRFLTNTPLETWSCGCVHFNQRVDRMMMLASVEGRVPYQHNAVVDLALSIGMGV